MLTVCPTPIGNLEDLTFRALKELSRADLIVCEDTRRSSKLLAHYNIKKPLFVLEDHREQAQIPTLLARLGAGEHLVLISDAGLPGLCDPGFKLIRSVREQGLPMTVLPGPSALPTALITSGLAAERFAFLGFLPKKKAALEKLLQEYAPLPLGLVAFEAPARLRATLAVMDQQMGERRVAVCRELSKRFEEVLVDRPASLLESLPTQPAGEIVLVVEKIDEAHQADRLLPKALEALKALSEAGIPPRRAASIISNLTGLAKSTLYRQTLEKESGMQGPAETVN